MPFSSPSAHAPGWDSSDPCVMLPDASEFLCDGSVTSVSLLKVTSLSAFVRALGVPGAGAGTMQGWPQKSCFTNMVRGVLNLSIPDLLVLLSRKVNCLMDRWHRDTCRGYTCPVPTYLRFAPIPDSRTSPPQTPCTSCLPSFLPLHPCHTLATPRCVWHPGVPAPCGLCRSIVLETSPRSC